MIERHHLAILREVDRQGSLTAASAALNLTQSALSHSIRKLEGQLGLVLWEKDGRSLRLTPAGIYLLSVAKRLLSQLEHADSVLQQMASGQHGTLRLGVECHPCHRWLLKVVAPYLKQWPGVDVDVSRGFQFGGVGALVSREIDLLLTPDHLTRPGLSFEPVFEYEQVLVLSKSHSLCQQRHICPEDLVEETLITYPVAVDRLDIFRDFLLPSGCRPRRHKHIEDTEILLQMVASNRGVAALPRWLVDESALKSELRCARLGPEGLRKQLLIGFRRDDCKVAHLNAFVSLARETGSTDSTPIQTSGNQTGSSRSS